VKRRTGSNRYEVVVDANGTYSCPVCGSPSIIPTTDGQLVCRACLTAGRVFDLLRPKNHRPVVLHGRVKLQRWVPDCERSTADRWADHRRSVKRRQTVDDWLFGWSRDVDALNRKTAQRNRRSKALNRLRKIKRRERREEQIHRRERRIVERMVSTGKTTGPIRSWWYTR